MFNGNSAKDKQMHTFWSKYKKLLSKWHHFDQNTKTYLANGSILVKIPKIIKQMASFWFKYQRLLSKWQHFGQNTNKY